MRDFAERDVNDDTGVVVTGSQGSDSSVPVRQGLSQESPCRSAVLSWPLLLVRILRAFDPASDQFLIECRLLLIREGAGGWRGTLPPG
jgi:hypothetical protein